MRLYIIIDCPDEKEHPFLKAVAENAAVSAGGELRSAFVDQAMSVHPVARALGFGVHTRTELYPPRGNGFADLLRKPVDIPNLEDCQ